MAFVVEDGTGLEEATSLVDIEFADAYFELRGNTVWAALSLEQKQAAAVLGTDYVNTQYNFRGQKLNPKQGTAFPRVNVFDPSGNPTEGVPNCVKLVTCELALRASQGTLVPDPVFDESGRAIKSLHQALGPLKRTITFAGPGELVAEARFPMVDALMCPWLVIPATKFSNGVRAVAPTVSGISNAEIFAVFSNSDRYSGPHDENGRDVGGGDGNAVI